MPPDDVRVTDPQVLKALAHPLRGRLLGLLRLDGPSTASRLGVRLGQSSGSTSYHLRQLAAYGLVVEDRTAGRERWWRAAHRMTSWEPGDLLTQPGGAQAVEAVQRMQVELVGRRLRDWLEDGSQFGPAWAAAAGLSDYVLRLTPEQTRELTGQVYEVLDRWATAHPAGGEAGPGAEAVTFLTAVLPFRNPP